jgi:hypothetical protein
MDSRLSRQFAEKSFANFPKKAKRQSPSGWAFDARFMTMQSFTDGYLIR